MTMQLELFNGPASPGRGRHVDGAAYSAIMALRRAGFVVYAAGYRRHKIRRPEARGFVIVTVVQMMKIAKQFI